MHTPDDIEFYDYDEDEEHDSCILIDLNDFLNILSVVTTLMSIFLELLLCIDLNSGTNVSRQTLTFAALLLFISILNFMTNALIFDIQTMEDYCIKNEDEND